jgi:flavin-dependent dehydrogenase
MEEKGDGWLLHFKDKPSVYADLVIAADGANSKVRPYLTSIRPMYSGVTMIEINISDPERDAPGIFKLLNGGKVMAFANCQCILGGQKDEGGIGFYLSFKTDENWA